MPESVRHALAPAPDPRPPGPPWRVVAALLAVALGGALFWLTPENRRFADPFQAESAFNSLVFAAPSPDGGLAVIDSSLRRVLRLGPDGQALCEVLGGSREPGQFFRAQEAAAAADGRLFVLAWAPDDQGFFVSREEIQEYGPDGRFVRVVRSVNLHPESADRLGYRSALRPLSRALTPREGGLRWLELCAEGLQAWSVGDGEAEPGRWYPFPDAQTDVAEACFAADGTVLLTHKAGAVYRLAPGHDPELAYDSGQDGRRDADGVPPVPWGVAAGPGETWFFSEMTFREVFRAAGGRWEGEAPIWSIERQMEACPSFAENAEEDGVSPDHLVFDRLRGGNGGPLALVSGETVTLLPGDGDAEQAVFLDGFVRSPAMRVQEALAWLGLALAAAGAVALAWLWVSGGAYRRLAAGAWQALGLSALVALTLAATLPLVVERLVDRQDQLQRSQLEQLLHTLPMVLDTRLVERLEAAGDYRGEDCQALRRQMNRVFLDPRATWNEGIYCALYRFRGGRLYAMMDSNDELGLFHPFAWTREELDLYQAAWAGGRASVFTSHDAQGDWLCGIGPLAGPDGQAVAVIEVGIDQHNQALGVRRLVEGAVKDALTLLVTLLLVLFEFLFLLRLRRRGRAGPGLAPAGPEGADRMSPFFVSRPMACAFFVALSFPDVFIPLHMRDLYRQAADPWLPEGMAIALPLSAHMLLFGLAVWAVGRRGARLRAGTAVNTGFLAAVAGLAASGAAQGMAAFTAAYALAGAASGIGFMGIRSLLLSEPDPGRKETGFAHFYSGMTAGVYAGLGVGAALAHYLGYRRTLLVAAGVMAAAWLFARLGMLPLASAAREAPPEGPEAPAPGGLLRHLFRPAALSFFLFHVFPLCTLAAFIGYYFPLFAEESGMEVGDIGRLLLLYGLLVIHGGPATTAWLLPRLGPRRAVALVHACWCLAVISFAVTGSLAWAVAALLLLGATEGLGAAASNTFFLRVASRRGLGEDRAAALAEMAGKMGEAAGPVVFALALAIGGTAGLLWLGLAGLALLALLALSFRVAGPMGRAGGGAP